MLENLGLGIYSGGAHPLGKLSRILRDWPWYDMAPCLRFIENKVHAWMHVEVFTISARVLLAVSSWQKCYIIMVWDPIHISVQSYWFCFHHSGRLVAIGRMQNGACTAELVKHTVRVQRAPGFWFEFNKWCILSSSCPAEAAFRLPRGGIRSFAEISPFPQQSTGVSHYSTPIKLSRIETVVY